MPDQFERNLSDKEIDKLTQDILDKVRHLDAMHTELIACNVYFHVIHSIFVKTLQWDEPKLFEHIEEAYHVWKEIHNNAELGSSTSKH